MIARDPHPLLDLRAFVTEFPRKLGEITSPPSLLAQLAPSAGGAVFPPADIQNLVRALLRHGGFKPSGRSKPASEYLIRAASDGTLSSINPAVDACNVVSLHSGLPISVVDLDRAQEPLSVRIADAGQNYVFNASGQTIDVAGLLCLFDDEGPCANAVKDAQRTKTTPDTRRTLSLIWGVQAAPNYAAKVETWYRELLSPIATTSPAPIA